MDHHHFKARPFGQASSMAVGSHNVIDQLLGQGPHRNPIGPDSITGAPLMEAVLLFLIRHVGTGKLTGMGQFQGRDGAMPTDGVCRIGGAGQGIQDAFIQMVGMGAVGGRMDHQFRNCDRPGSSFGPEFIKGRGFRADASVIGDVRTSHGSGEDPVTESGASQGDGAGQMGKFALHVIASSKIISIVSVFHPIIKKRLPSSKEAAVGINKLLIDYTGRGQTASSSWNRVSSARFWGHTKNTCQGAVSRRGICRRGASTGWMAASMPMPRPSLQNW